MKQLNSLNMSLIKRTLINGVRPSIMFTIKDKGSERN